MLMSRGYISCLVPCVYKPSKVYGETKRGDRSDVEVVVHVRVDLQHLLVKHGDIKSTKGEGAHPRELTRKRIYRDLTAAIYFEYIHYHLKIEHTQLAM